MHICSLHLSPLTLTCYINAKAQVGEWFVKPAHPAPLNGVNVAATSPVSFLPARAMAKEETLMFR